MTKKRFPKNSVFVLNPKTCGIYKSGGSRFRVDAHGQRTQEIDNELLEHVQAFLAGKKPAGMALIPSKNVLSGVLVPRYFDSRWEAEFEQLLARKGLQEVTLGDLVDQGILLVRGGHGSPGNDQRIGSVPYVKVSDIRNLRININPTNLVPLQLARKFWRADNSGLRAWDLISPNRASSNIGEFAVILPGEEDIVLTKEMFLFRVAPNDAGWDPFYLLWALCLREVRLQWQRITLMQTNREDVGQRYREIRLPTPSSPAWATKVSSPFREYFQTISEAKLAMNKALSVDGFHYIASVFTALPTQSQLLSAEEPILEGVKI